MSNLLDTLDAVFGRENVHVVNTPSDLERLNQFLERQLPGRSEAVLKAIEEVEAEHGTRNKEE